MSARTRVLRLWFILSLVKLGTAVFELPNIFDFSSFAFQDAGVNLTSQYLMGIGLVPYVDFGHQYGLLPLLFGKIWFLFWGFTPHSCVAAMSFLNLVQLLALARFIETLKIQRAGVWLFICALPHMGGVLYPNLSFALEAVLLTHALAFHAQNERSKALALATAALFVKPSMAYFYGAVLLVLIFRNLLARPVNEWVNEIMRELMPAVATLASLAAVLCAIFGFEGLFHSLFLLPFQGLEVYRFYQCGFFDLGGRMFVYPTGVRIGYYLGTVAGFWLIATAFLLVAGVVVAAKSYRSDPKVSREITVICAFLHIVFIFILYAGPHQYWYYFYLIVMGICAITVNDKKWRPILYLFAFMAALGCFTRGKMLLKEWASKERNPLTAGLWAAPDLRAEWAHVLGLSPGERPVLLTYAGCGDLLFKEFAKPVSNYFYYGWRRPAEVARKARQLAEASFVIDVLPMDIVYRHKPMSQWPEFSGSLAGHDRIYQGIYFMVYRRKAPNLDSSVSFRRRKTRKYLPSHAGSKAARAFANSGHSWTGWARVRKTPRFTSTIREAHANC